MGTPIPEENLILPPGETSTFKERLNYAISTSGYRGKTAVENVLMNEFPDLFSSKGFMSSYTTGRRGESTPDPKRVKAISVVLHVSFEWLMVGTGPVRPLPPREPAVSSVREVLKSPRAQARRRK